MVLKDQIINYIPFLFLFLYEVMHKNALDLIIKILILSLITCIGKETERPFNEWYKSYSKGTWKLSQLV